ncbi:MAG: hypothetical protein ACLQHF_07755 [Terracidiphilus sp.]
MVTPELKWPITNFNLTNDGWPSPSWQANSGVTGTSGLTARAIPDVSFFSGDGSLGSATLICVSDLGACVTSSTVGANPVTVEPTAQEVGGTSVATPEMAGVMALINQKAGAPQGLPNNQLYELAAKENYSECSAETVKNTSTSCYCQSIDEGTNAMACSLGTAGGEGGAIYLGGGQWDDTAQPYTGLVSPNCDALNSGDTIGTLVSSGATPAYNATAGFNMATGLGSLNVYNVVNKWVSETGTATAALTSPAPSTVLTGPKVTFDWTTAAGATGYNLWLGTTVGADDIYSSGEITATSATPANLPTNGETIYARLYTDYGSVSVYTDYTFTAATLAAALTSPTPGTVLTGPKVTFTWTTAPGATNYYFRLGTSVGANNLYGSGEITTTSATVYNLPTNGETIYARLYTDYGSIQVYTDYVFTAATQAALTSPAPNTVLAGPKVTFTWSTAPGAIVYYFRLGTSVGANNLYGSGATTATSVTPANLPTNGEKIYARLYTYYSSSQAYTDYTYTAAATP